MDLQHLIPTHITQDLMPDEPPIQFVLERSQIVPISVEKAFSFFSDARNLEAITPPWLNFSILSCPSILSQGALIEYQLKLHGVPIRWRTVIEVWEPNVRFVDRQLKGPYALWRHEHTFHAAPGGTEIRDRVEYALPFGIIGLLAQRLLVRNDVMAIFNYRRERIRELVSGS